MSQGTSWGSERKVGSDPTTHVPNRVDVIFLDRILERSEAKERKSVTGNAHAIVKTTLSFVAKRMKLHYFPEAMV